MAPITIRTAGVGDLLELAVIFRLASLSNEGDRANLLAHPEHLELDGQAVLDRRVRVAEVEGRPVGFVTVEVEGSKAELVDLFVHPDQVRLGVATRLIADAVERARLAGAERIEVTGNPHAHAFYRSVGFQGHETVETSFGPGTRLVLPVGR